MIKAKKALEKISPQEFENQNYQWRLKLDKNENIYGCANNILSAIKNISSKEISNYPIYENLFKKLSEKYKLNKTNFLITNGTNDALKNITETYLESNETIYYFLNSKENINKNNKIIYIESPSTQTGEIIKASDIEYMLNKYNDKLFVINCSYISYSNLITLEDYIDLIKKHDNIAIIKSYSNDFAIAGLRFAIIIANNTIIDNIKKIISPYSVNSIAVQCALMILNDNKRMEEIKEWNNSAKILFEEILQKNNIEFYKSEANFILCNFKNYCDFYYEKFKKQSVITKKYSSKSNYENYLRITIPTLGGVKFIGELLNKKNVIIFDTTNVLFNEKELLISADTLNELSKRYDLVIYSSDINFEQLETYKIQKYFYSIHSSKNIEISKYLNKIPYNTIKFFSADVNNIIKANMANLETIGIVPIDSNQQTVINNYKHLGINYITSKTINIENF
ncbi:MAG: aminotransferase class I/II-fold pyridoxal phosphate-dependent enzyme [Candidatus Gastranaerophilales bacterium]|nr:aminotransferase class I/II-fold pyridoxal phosphate-dependent enzyme [Candidatus Gastranaerophilales bacterium]